MAGAPCVVAVIAVGIGVTGVARRRQEARVFLSSTFVDMQGERDVLTRHVRRRRRRQSMSHSSAAQVFPELRRRARGRRVHVREVDLRWGVSEEVGVALLCLLCSFTFRLLFFFVTIVWPSQEAASGAALGTCLREIDRCRPFFVGLLGHRYGWQVWRPWRVETARRRRRRLGSRRATPARLSATSTPTTTAPSTHRSPGCAAIRRVAGARRRPRALLSLQPPA